MKEIKVLLVEGQGERFYVIKNDNILKSFSDEEIVSHLLEHLENSEVHYSFKKFAANGPVDVQMEQKAEEGKEELFDSLWEVAR